MKQLTFKYYLLVILSLYLFNLGHASTSIPIRFFNSDGCTLSPDGVFNHSFAHCCVAHDRKYWQGGPKSEKDRADANLKQCTAKTL